MSLNDYMAASSYDVSGFVGMETNYNYNGEQVALPFRSDFWVLYYNKTLVDNAGVAYPTNDMAWEEYKEKAIALSGNGNIAMMPMGYWYVATLINNVFYTIVTVPLTLMCSIVLALVLNRAVKGAVAFRAILFFPYVASMVAICVCWNFMLMKDGPINQILMSLGSDFNKSWTADSTMAMWAIILVGVWRSMGYYMEVSLWNV